MMKKDSERISLYSTLMGNIMPNLIPAHIGGPLSQGILKEDVVTCPWHGWKYNIRTGKSPHKGGDSVNGFVTKVIGNKLYIDPIPSTLGNKVYTPHKKYADLQNSVKNHLTLLDKDSRMP